jgi:type I restriction enzyme S subunit
MTQGVAQKKVSLGRFSSLAVPIPSYDEQMVIVDHISTVLKEAHSQEVSLIQSLKQSAAQRKNILKAAFSGQLVPQDSNDEPASVLLERIKSERVTQKIPSKFLKGHKTTEAS